MKGDLPDDIEDAIDILMRSERATNLKNRIELFEEGISTINECLSEYPDYEEVILRQKLVYTRSLIMLLKDGRPDIDPDVWLKILFSVVIVGKNELKQLVAKDAAIKDYMAEFLLLWANDGSLQVMKKALEEALE